jgi:hypothetical protein
MLTIKFVNDGLATGKRANYDAFVTVNDERVAIFKVTNHNRRAGWRGLLSAAVRTLATLNEGTTPRVKLVDKLQPSLPLVEQ